MPDTFTIEISPAARIVVLNRAISYKGPFEKPEQGKAFRSLHKAIALDVIKKTATRNKDQISTVQANDDAPTTFTVTWEETQILTSVLASQPNDGRMEMIVGPVTDQLAAITDGSPLPCTAAPYDASKESWDPPAPDAPPQ